MGDIDGTLVGAIFAGLTGLITAIGGLIAASNTKGGRDEKTLKRRLRYTIKERDAATSALEKALGREHHLRSLLAANGITIPLELQRPIDASITIQIPEDEEP